MAILGFNGVLTINSANPGFTNLRTGQTHTEVDATTNLDGGNKSYVKGLKDMYIAADMNLDNSTACQTVLTAVNSRDPVTCTATWGSGTGAVSITGSMMVFGSEISSGLDEVPKMTVTCRPAPSSGTTTTTGTT